MRWEERQNFVRQEKIFNTLCLFNPFCRLLLLNKDLETRKFGFSCPITKAARVGKIDVRCCNPCAMSSLLKFYLFSLKNARRRAFPKCRPKGISIPALEIRLTDLFSMQLPLESFVCLVFLLGLTRGLPIPGNSNSNIAPFGVFPLAYSRRGLSLPENRSSATGYSPVGRPQIWGGTPANTAICRYPSLWTGKWWWVMGSVALILIALYGLLAFVLWGIMSVDLPRLMVWNRTGDEQRR